jgi:hypothetical protein
MLPYEQELTMPALKTLNMELLAGLKPGLWAAISYDQERFVSTARTLDEVIRKAERKGEKKPFTIRVPDPHTAWIL